MRSTSILATCLDRETGNIYDAHLQINSVSYPQKKVL